LPHVTSTNEANEAIRVWLTLSPLLVQDGFYTFRLMPDSIRATSGQSALQSSGTVVVMSGGNGMIDATLTFNLRGRLTAVSQEAHLVPGPRPICQSTLRSIAIGWCGAWPSRISSSWGMLLGTTWLNSVRRRRRSSSVLSIAFGGESWTRHAEAGSGGPLTVRVYQSVRRARRHRRRNEQATGAAACCECTRIE
jgi:hypothetical protein